ncbi:hypothetical protein BCR33DRAFT_289740 [Rhizoclosmatium globosum]|uniref:Uncharacterized protein n=1 Tax=Rhizoclosmatium globosum TaxID=329046 RepID=A0A1Y2C7B7_9FUNG|nr:hypothetical protein BCR33DRAFT_289740 [Rhizoclosmatium globosum]|eukprot:ORY42922.1 hypothetical protein BCR33DRAFT_289740 [Rhizoclosmatium globosum]
MNAAFLWALWVLVQHTKRKFQQRKRNDRRLRGLVDDFTETSHKLPLFLGVCSKVLSNIPRESMTKSWILKLSESNRSERIPMRLVGSRKAGVKKTSPTSATGASNISISSSLPYGTVMNEAEETALDEPAVFQSRPSLNL